MKLFIAEDDGIECTIRDNDDQEDGCLPGLVAQAVTPLDAKIIVRAVNCHDDLLAIVDRVANRGKIDEEWVQAARAAIAKATGV